jgi:pimeloyl-ACP methyl ester carboxylesterase
MKKTVLSLLSAAFAVSAIASCSSDAEEVIVNSNTYVLVHGAWQAPYVWNAVSTDLTNKGNKVVVVELPGHGSDKTPTYQLSLDVYRDKVIEAISKLDGKVILVGHSMGGMVVTSVAEKIPSKISKLVYIGAFIPASGQSLGELANTDPDSKLGPQLTQSEDKLTLDVNHDKLTELFISDGTQAAKDQVVANYRPEPAIPFGNPITLTNDHFGAVDKVYIKTLRDIVISPGLQDRMIAGAGIKNVYSVNTSHSPFLSQPQAVADILLKVGQDVANVKH